MKIFIPKEVVAHEKRVALSPEIVKKLVDMKCVVTVESGAGLGVSITDDHFKNAGAKVVKKSTDMYKGAQLICKVQPPSVDELKHYPRDVALVSTLNILNQPKDIEVYAKHKVSAFALELIPRITRAQSMDVLSSQSNLAGYRAVIEAAHLYDKAFPMMMTAAGTVLPAKVLVVGAGVAGLQAIATARRLGAVVMGYDVRPAAKEQVESLGATFVEVDGTENAETAGGYAKEMGADYQRRQEAKLKEVVGKMDIIITTALIPGRDAPKIISESMLKQMGQGSVVIDLAVERGGNCFGSVRGKVADVHGVKVYGPANLPSAIGRNATELYARNIYNLLQLVYNAEKKALVFNHEDEIVKAALLTENGAILRDDLLPSSVTRTAMRPAAKSAPKKRAAPKAKTPIENPSKKVVKKAPKKKEKK